MAASTRARGVALPTVLALSARRAAAVGDEVRTAMLDVLSEREASIEELVGELRKRGIRKAPTTLRHHLDVLKRAGLVRLVRTEPARGAVLKYYAANARVLNYELPPEAAQDLEPAVQAATSLLEPVILELRGKHARRVRAVAKRLRPCPYCDAQHFEEFVLAHVLQQALGRALAAEAVA